VRRAKMLNIRNANSTIKNIQRLKIPQNLYNVINYARKENVTKICNIWQLPSLWSSTNNELGSSGEREWEFEGGS
jgi:hypothetical protein